MNSFFMNDEYDLYDLKSIIRSIPANAFFKDDKCRYQLVSHVCSMLNGEDENFSMIGKTDLEIQKEEVLGRQYYEEDCRLIRDGGSMEYISEMHFYGETYYYKISKQAVRGKNGDNIGIVGLITDVTELIKARKQLEIISYNDPLTGARTRNYLRFMVEESSHGSAGRSSVVIFDMNDLKKINDEHGHRYGDLMLRQTVDVTKVCMPEGCEIFRLGGDEFAMILWDMDMEAAGRFMAKLAEEVRKIDIRGIHVTFAYGINEIEPGNIDRKDLLNALDKAIEAADSKMYNMKKNMKMVI